MSNSDYDNFDSKCRVSEESIANECQLFQSNFQEIQTFVNCYNTYLKSDTGWNEFLAGLNDGQVRIVFSGVVKSGKSYCIMEFFSGSINLPSRDCPTTTYVTNLIYSKDPVLYSKCMSNNECVFHTFDGKKVPNDLVGRTKDNLKSNTNLDIIYYVGVNHNILKQNLNVIDSPGLNETEELSDSVCSCITKLNPHIMVYIFDCGPGFSKGDEIFFSKLVRQLRKDLQILFLFNKFDNAFKVEERFPDIDEPISGDGMTDEEDTDEEDFSSDVDFDISKILKIKEKYDEHHKNHRDKVRELLFVNEPFVMIGYSGRVVKSSRERKEVCQPFLLEKHISFLQSLNDAINVINVKTATIAIDYVTKLLFEHFTLIHGGILKVHGKYLHKTKLTLTIRKEFLNQFDRVHECLLDIDDLHSIYIDIYEAVGSIIKNQGKRATNASIETVLYNIIQAVGKFLLDRYYNLFSNHIQTILDKTDFRGFQDQLRYHDVSKFFHHTSCLLRVDDQEFNLESMIKNHFDNKIDVFMEKVKAEKSHNLETYDGKLCFIKTHFNMKNDMIWKVVEQCIRDALAKEKCQLEAAIDMKQKEIQEEFRMTQSETERKIKKTIQLINILLNLHKNLIITWSRKQCSVDKRSIFESIVKDTFNQKDGIIQLQSGCSLLIKREEINFAEIDCQRYEFIKYVIQSQYISRFMLKCTLFHHEEKNILYFISDLEMFLPIRRILSNLNFKQKLNLIESLLEAINILFEKLVPIENFGPDMLFCRIVNDEKVEMKIMTTTNYFGKWSYRLSDESDSNYLFHKYPFYNADMSVSEMGACMIYSLSWTVLIILYGSCVQLITGPVTDKHKYFESFKKELDSQFRGFLNDQIYKTGMEVIRKCLRRPFRDENVEQCLSDLMASLKGSEAI